MSDASLDGAGYDFGAGLPLEPVPAGTNVLVTGPSIGPTERVVHRMLDSESDGAILIASDDAPDEHVRAFETAGGAFDATRMAVVSCAEAVTDAGEANVRILSSPEDLTGIGMQWSELYDDLDAAGVSRVRTGLYSLSSILTYCEDHRAVFRFMHTVTGRVSGAGGLGVVGLDPATQDERILSTLGQLFDGRIEVREGDGCEIAVRGLADQPDGWLPLE